MKTNQSDFSLQAAEPELGRGFTSNTSPIPSIAQNGQSVENVLQGHPLADTLLYLKKKQNERILTN